VNLNVYVGSHVSQPQKVFQHLTQKPTIVFRHISVNPQAFFFKFLELDFGNEIHSSIFGPTSLIFQGMFLSIQLTSVLARESHGVANGLLFVELGVLISDRGSSILFIIMSSNIELTAPGISTLINRPRLQACFKIFAFGDEA